MFYGADEPATIPVSVDAPSAETIVPVPEAPPTPENEEEETWAEYFKRIVGITAIQRSALKVAKSTQKASHNLQATTCIPAVQRELNEIAELPSLNAEVIKDRASTYNERVLEV